MQKVSKLTRAAAEPGRRYSVNRPIWSRDIRPALRTLVSLLAPERTRDLGAGESRSAIWLAEQGGNLRAIDFSSVASIKAEEFAAEAEIIERIAFKVTDVTKITPERSSYVLVRLIYLHLSRDVMPTVVRKTFDALRSGGAFVLLGHNETNHTHAFGGLQDPGYLHGPQDIFEATAPILQVSRAKRVDRTVGAPSWPRTAIDYWLKGNRKGMT